MKWKAYLRRFWLFFKVAAFNVRAFVDFSGSGGSGRFPIPGMNFLDMLSVLTAHLYSAGPFGRLRSNGESMVKFMGKVRGSLGFCWRFSSAPRRRARFTRAFPVAHVLLNKGAAF
jgi:hypothetical protein